MSLKRQAVRGLKWTTIAAVVNTLLQLLQLLVLARLLSKEHFGLMALAMVLVGFAQIVSDMGITNAIIQKQNVTSKQLHSIYTINLAIGAGLCLLLLLVASPAAGFYNNPELAGVIRWLSLIFIIQPFGQIYNALLRKGLLFDAIAKRDMLVKLIGFGASVTMAIMGFGVYSFVGAQLATTVMSTLLLLLLGRHLYRPKLYISGNDIRPFIHFSAYQLGDQLVTFFRMQLDVLLIGKIMGIELAGTYNIAKRLIDYPISIINPVVTQVSFPVMAKVQDETMRLKNIFLKTERYISSIGFPIYAFIALFAYNLIILSVGKEWAEAAPIMQILCIYGLIRVAFNPTSSLVLSKGLVNRSFWWNVGCLIIMPAFLLLGIPWGITGIAWGVSISYLFTVIPLWLVLVKPSIPCTLGEYLLQFVYPLLTATCITMLALPVCQIQSPMLQLVVAGLVFLLSFLPLSRLINATFYNELILQIKEAWGKHIKHRQP